MSDTSTLTKLGSQKTKYYTEPSVDILETFENQHQDNLYLVPFVMPFAEFTSLCPKTGQPDFAKIEIIYIPNVKMVESKSLKLYLFSFRNSGEFHEDVCNRIAKDLFLVLQPRYLRVFGDFSPRGGLAIKPMVEMWDNNISEAEELSQEYFKGVEIVRKVNSWDIKNK